jgi:capsular polysaccharide biosynthesis protein
MELAEILKAIGRHRRATLLILLAAVGTAVALKISAGSAPTGAATVQLLVDSPASQLATLNQEPAQLASRAAVFSQVMASQAVLDQIATGARVPTGELTAQGPYSGAGQSLNVVTPSEARSNQLVSEKAAYRLTFVPQLDEPIITTTVQAPNTVDAARVANAVYPGVQKYIDSLQSQSGIPRQQRVTLRLLGSPQVAEVNASSGTAVAGAGAVGVLLLGGLLILVFDGQWRGRRELAELDGALMATDQNGVDPRLGAHAGADPHKTPR